MKKILLTLAVCLVIPIGMEAQTQETAGRNKVNVEAERNSAFEFSTNLLDWADLATINLDAGVSVSRNFSLHVTGKFNPWEFKPKSGPISLVQNKHWMVAAGAKYWPWYVFSGWWFGAKVQYCDFAETGIWRQAYNTGKALGAGLSAGYAFIISKNFNIEIGAGFWGGKLLQYAIYNCPDDYCMNNPRESGSKGFVALNDLNVSLHWVF